MMELRASYDKYIKMKITFLFVLLVLLIATAVVSLNVGSSGMTVRESLLTIFGKGSDTFNQIVFNIRLPRIIGGFFVGMSVALSGMIIQSVLNNPLASPGTLGISNASAFGANVAIVVLVRLGIEVGSFVTGLSSFIAAMGCTALVIWFSSLKKANRTTVLLAGVALNALFSSVIVLIQYFADDSELASAVSWTFGDLGRIDYSEIIIVATVFLLSAFLIYLLRWRYNAMDMGESTAHSLGVNTKYMRNLSILLASLNTGISVAYVGMIGFVGLLSPQITKRVIGEDKRFLLPGTVIMGALIVLFSDTVGRTIASPHVLPVGAITSLIGAPFFIYILLKER